MKQWLRWNDPIIVGIWSNGCGVIFAVLEIQQQKKTKKKKKKYDTDLNSVDNNFYKNQFSIAAR